MRVPSLDWEDPLEEGMATHSSNVGWRIPRDGQVTLGPSGHEESDMTEATWHTCTHLSPKTYWLFQLPFIF